jgi:histidinol-phosphate aminotransferase
MKLTTDRDRRFLRPEIAELPAYAAPVADAPIRLDRNESPEEPSEALRERVLSELAAARWSRYPDPYAATLKEAIARRESVSQSAVIVANGSNALLFSLFVAIASPGRRVALCPPTFGLYAPWIRGAGARPSIFPLAEEDLSPPVEEMCSAAAGDPDLAFVLCSPNNPTGTVFPRDGLVALAESGALVVVDEAYAEFSGSTAGDLLPRFRNLVLARTMSKAMALAGARIGYMLGAPELLGEIEKLLPPYGVNLFARAAAAASLADEAETRRRVEAIVAERERMARALQTLPGARLSPSAANFLYVRPERPAGELFEELRRRGILVRRVAGTRAEALRVTVGRPAENDRFLEAWREVIA